MSSNRTFRLAFPALFGFLVLALSGCADLPTASEPGAAVFSKAANAPNKPVRLDFEKCAVAAGVWEGTVAGDIEGDLRTELTELRVTGPVWHVRFNWIITAGEQSFTADLKGILNTVTGRVVMNGRIVEGYLAGAQVHEQGQLVDADRSCFAGTIRVMPATAR
ncbi:MAG TPA: hypothetical protein VGR27_12095 [Longimicrobiaceae bacterium]|nr:hypothetical protein [Longimicrobiaceae bacterium]